VFGLIISRVLAELFEIQTPALSAGRWVILLESFRFSLGVPMKTGFQLFHITFLHCC
jgi:hypothetical protein